MPRPAPFASGLMAAWLSLAPVALAVPPDPAPSGLLADCRDAGERLWGRSLCAPVVVVDPATGAFEASVAAPGALPAVRANTAFDWKGEPWIMLLAPLPADPAAARALAFHEAFHVQQRALGLPPNDATAAHLDTRRGRYWLRLEWAALEAALRAKDADVRAPIADALAFRARRLARDARARTAEREQMLHEGLAAYTGVALSGDAERLALEELHAGASRSGLSRSFAYVNGPAWGLLLDRIRPGWRRGMSTAIDLPDLADIAPAAHPRPGLYGGTRIGAEETRRETAQRVQRRRLLQMTSPTRALRLPLQAVQMDFDPNGLTPLDDGSTAYGRLTLRASWGALAVHDTPVRIDRAFAAAYVAWPLRGDDRLDLAPGWSLCTDVAGAVHAERAPVEAGACAGRRPARPRRAHDRPAPRTPDAWPPSR